MDQLQTVSLNTNYNQLNQPPLPTGATLTVKSTADTVDAKPGDGICADSCGNCTLRAAIMEANAFPGDDTINFDPSVFNVAQTITLSIPGVNEDSSATGDLDITSGLTITGPGANLTTIDGGGIDRVLQISPGSATNVRVSGLTLTGGKALNTYTDGGHGGGITNGGTLTLTNVTVKANSADLGGGGITNEVSGTLTINSGTVSGNVGGGIFSWGIGHTVTLNSSTVSGNTAPGWSGGGIVAYQGTLILNNSTVSGNAAKYGGGIVTSNHGIVLNLNNSTVTGNSGIGGGISLGEYATLNLKNTILAGNSTDCLIGSTDVVNSLGHNLDGDGTCHLDSAKGDLSNTAAQLAPLALNLPGSTKTHALCTGPGAPDTSCLAASPAIDKGGDCLAVDQRGVPRPQGAACDIGAYEVGAGPNGAACIPPPNMVAWWPLDRLNSSGEYDDYAGGDNNGTPTGNPSQIPNQYVGNSLQAGIGKFVTVPDAPNLNLWLGSFTIDAWVKYTSGTQTEPIAYKLANASGSGGGYFFYLNKNRLYLQIGPKIFSGPQFSVPIGTWIFVAATVHKNSPIGSVTLYVGVPGKSLATSTSSAGNVNASSPGTPLLIGAWPGNPYAALGIDEVEIFNRALTQQPEIQSLFNAGSAGKCSITEKKGMTWYHMGSDPQYGTITVGCGAAGPDRCDAAKGDTPCSQQLPVLCIYKPNPAFQKPIGLKIPNEYMEWSGGVVATTQPVAGDTFKDKDITAVNAYCEAQFGKGWRVAEFHDGRYWFFQAYGGTVSAPTVPSTRFWVHINDQKDGNCWKLR